MKIRESLQDKRNLAFAAVLTLGATSLFATSGEAAPVADSPYEGTEVLVYAPSPLTAGEAIDYFVDRDQVRANEANQAAWAGELTSEFEAQTGLDADAQFPGNDHGTNFIRIEG